MATPFVSGLATLILSVNPGLTPAQIRAVIEQTADDVELPGWDSLTGWGRINAYRALLAAKGDIPIAMPVENAQIYSSSNVLQLKW